MKFYLKTKDYSVTQEIFDLQLNEDLELLVTHPVPEQLTAYYESEDYISHTDSRKSLGDKIYHIIKRINLKNKLKLVQQHSSGHLLLDVGAGTGDFLLRAKQNGWNVSGVEPNTKAAAKALKKGLQLNSSLADVVNQKFDVITLWHVLEHLPDLNDQISRLCDLLTDTGVLIIAVPNYKSFDATHYKKYWAAFDVPRHLWHFSKTAISKLFLKEGMQVTKIYPMVFDAFYVSLLSEKYKTGKQRFLPAFFIGLRSNIKAMCTKEYSSLIYVLKKAK